MYFVTQFIIITTLLLCNEITALYQEPLVKTKTALNISQATYCLDTDSIWNCSTCDTTNKLDTILNTKGEQVLFG